MTTSSAKRIGKEIGHPQASITQTSDEEGTCWRIKLTHLDAAKCEAALASHRDALVVEWKHDHDNGEHSCAQVPPLPGTLEAFMRLVETGWDVEAARRPHGQHTTVVVHSRCRPACGDVA